jgi:ribosome-associated heat shock protein Hsp15
MQKARSRIAVTKDSRQSQSRRSIIRQPDAGAEDSHVSKTENSTESDTAGVRLDVWLWATRFFKTRALAKRAVESGRIVLNDQEVAKPGKTVRVGDRLRIVRGEETFEIGVSGLIDQRAPAPIAQAQYAETPERQAARAAAAERRRNESAGYTRPASKPDKRARRLIRALGDLDMT